jgi:hypothetical protein
VPSPVTGQPPAVHGHEFFAQPALAAVAPMDYPQLWARQGLEPVVRLLDRTRRLPVGTSWGSQRVPPSHHAHAWPPTQPGNGSCPHSLHRLPHSDGAHPTPAPAIATPGRPPAWCERASPPGREPCVGTRDPLCRSSAGTNAPLLASSPVDLCNRRSMRSDSYLLPPACPSTAGVRRPKSTPVWQSRSHPSSARHHPRSPRPPSFAAPGG